jgi:hypothetical protein
MPTYLFSFCEKRGKKKGGKGNRRNAVGKIKLLWLQTITEQGNNTYKTVIHIKLFFSITVQYIVE